MNFVRFIINSKHNSLQLQIQDEEDTDRQSQSDASSLSSQMNLTGQLNERRKQRRIRYVFFNLVETFILKVKFDTKNIARFLFED